MVYPVNSAFQPSPPFCQSFRRASISLERARDTHSYQASPRLSLRGPATPPPDYSRIDSNPLNNLLTNIFLSKLEAELGVPSKTSGYDGVINTVKALAERHRSDRAALRDASERVLMSLFPPWLPPAFAVLFSKPFPRFSAWINGAVTVAVTQWLMGPSKLAEDGVTVEIERCRYLEGMSNHPTILFSLDPWCP